MLTSTQSLPCYQIIPLCFSVWSKQNKKKPTQIIEPAAEQTQACLLSMLHILVEKPEVLVVEELTWKIKSFSIWDNYPGFHWTGLGVSHLSQELLLKSCSITATNLSSHTALLPSKNCLGSGWSAQQLSDKCKHCVHFPEAQWSSALPIQAWAGIKNQGFWPGSSYF